MMVGARDRENTAAQLGSEAVHDGHTTMSVATECQPAYRHERDERTSRGGVSRHRRRKSTDAKSSTAKTAASTQNGAPQNPAASKKKK